MSYLLDTKIIAAHLKNDEKIREKIEEAKFWGEKLYISIRGRAGSHPPTLPFGT